MIIPIGHENPHGRRWPWVTTLIVAICTVVFLATNGPMQRQLADTGRVEVHILVLNALYPAYVFIPRSISFPGGLKTEHSFRLRNCCLNANLLA